MNGYVAFYKRKRYEVYGSTLIEARDKLAKQLKVTRPWEINIMLAEKNGQEVTHVPT